MDILECKKEILRNASLTKAEKELIEGISADDNPVLMLEHLVDF